jgi:hypothetical protein
VEWSEHNPRRIGVKSLLKHPQAFDCPYC